MNNLGFVRVAACAPRLWLGDVNKNKKEILAIISKLEEVSVAVFPELSLCGSTLGNMVSHSLLISACQKAITDILNTTKNIPTIIIIGAPYYFEGSLYNCAFVMYKGKLLAVIPKENLSKNELRFYSRSKENINNIYFQNYYVKFGNSLVFETDNFTFGVEIGEDALLPLSPSTKQAAHGADIIFNLSAIPAAYGKNNEIKNLLKAKSFTDNVAYVFANAGYGESTSDNVFTGFCSILELGNLIKQNKPYTLTSNCIVADCDITKIRHKKIGKYNNINCNNFQTIKIEHQVKYSLPVLRTFNPKPFIPCEKKLDEQLTEIINIQTNALATRLEKTGIKNIVIGVSGGLDSTLALLVAVKTLQKLNLPNNHIHAITMPGFGTGKKTHSNADKLMSLLNTKYKTINIEKAVNIHFDDIGHDTTKHDVTYENSQARERTQILMDYANMVNGLVLGTGDLSEISLGWNTYNGDHMSMYNVNCSVPKTLIPLLINHIAKSMGEDIYNVCLDVINTPISPELLPSTKGDLNQKTEEIIGDYNLHDFFIFNFIDSGSNADRLYVMAKQAFEGMYDEKYIQEVLNKFIRRFFSQQFKRNCSPDGPAIGPISLSPRGAWQMPSDMYSSLWDSVNLSLNDEEFKA